MFELETGTIFWTITSFGVLIFILYKFVFPPLNRVLEQRRIEIDGKLKNAEKANLESENLLKKYQAQLKESEENTLIMFEEARRKSEALKEEALKNAQKEAGLIVESTRKDIDVLKRKALFDLKKDITQVVVEVSRRLIKKSLNPDDHAALVESSINELEKNAKKHL